MGMMSDKAITEGNERGDNKAAVAAGEGNALEWELFNEEVEALKFYAAGLRAEE